MFKKGDKVVRIEGKGYGWDAWCNFCKGLGIPPLYPVNVVRDGGGRESDLVVTYNGNIIGSAWRRENFNLFVQAKPLTEYM